MASGDARIVITVDSAGGVKAVQDFDRALEQMKGTTGGATPAVGGLERAIGSLAGQFTVATLAAGFINRGLADMKGFFVSSVKDMMEEEASLHRLATALQMAGNAGLGTYNRLVEFSKAEQNATVYSDETVRSAMALLETMVKLDEAGLKKATQGVEGLASVMGVDLETAARRVMMAMEGNAAGLSRYGIHLDATLPKEQQHAQLLDQLVRLYPRATAELETISGKLAQNKNLWGELKENLGKVISDLLDIPGTLTAVNDALKKYNKNLEDNAHSTSAARLEMSMMYGYVSAFVPHQEYVNMAWTNMSAKVKAVASDIVNYVNPAFREAANELDHIKVKLLEFNPEALVHYIQYVDTDDPFRLREFNQELVEVEPHFGEFTDDLDQTSIVLGILDIDLEENRKKWHYLYEQMEQNKRLQEELAGSLVMWGDSSKGVLQLIGAEWGNLTKTILMNLEKQVLAQEIASMKIVTAKKEETIANYIASLFESLPWFIAIPLSIAAFAVINTLFAKILKFSSGFEGIVRQPTLFLAGEAGPERVSVRNQAQGFGGGGNTSISVIVHAASLGDADLRRAGAKIAREVQYQLGRKGKRLLN